MEAVIVYAYLIRHFFDIKDSPDLENGNGFFLPLSVLEESTGLNQYAQAKALEILEEKGVIKVIYKGRQNCRFIELDLESIESNNQDFNQRLQDYVYCSQE
jgi:hypothetical protein